jgi:hypothetical protein
MENLIQLLLTLANKVPYLSESEKDNTLDLLREVEAHLGVSGVVPPHPGPVNAPAPAPKVPVPGPVAQPVPPERQPLPPTFAAAAAAPEASNAFSGVTPPAKAKTQGAPSW